MPLVERACDDVAEHSVAEELEPLIIRAFADALMAQGELEQADVLGIVAEPVADEAGNIAAHSASPV